MCSLRGKGFVFLKLFGVSVCRVECSIGRLSKGLCGSTLGKYADAGGSVLDIDWLRSCCMKITLSVSLPFFALLFALFSGNVLADACPLGMVINPIGAGGQPQCVPGENHQNWGGTGSSGPH